VQPNCIRIRIFFPVDLASGLLLPLAFSLLPVAAAEDLSMETRIVAQTERAFSARCVEIGIRDSFLQYFASDAIHFEPEPRLARPDLERESRSTEIRLTWEPKIIRVANSGQLAVSTGPYLLQSTAGKQSFGYFLSIWRKQSGGEWRVSADIGIPAPQRSDFPEDFQTINDPSVSEPSGRSGLLAFERQQFKPDVDIDTIYRSIALPETILERANLPLMNGESKYDAFLAAQKTRNMQLSESGGDVSGNLGFTYGTESEEGSRTAYLRVWIWRQPRWWLLFDVATARF
jgi:hypothetical protein